MTARIRARCASTTSTEEIAPERIAAAVSTADHCQTGPLGGRGLVDFFDADFFAAFLAAVLVVFFFAVFLTVFLATSRLAHSVTER